MKKKKLSGDWIFGIVVTIVAIALLAMITILNKDKDSGDDSKETETSYADTADIITDNQPFLGEENAPVTVVEYGDYKCMHCGNFSTTTFQDIKKKFIDTKKIKFVFKNYAFLNEDSYTAAAYANAIFASLGNEAFWEFNESLYKKQVKLYEEDISAEAENIFTVKYLNELAVNLFGKEDAKTVEIDFVKNEESYRAQVEKDRKEASANGVTGTPTVFVNGIKMYNSFDVSEMEELISQQTSDSPTTPEAKNE